MKRIFCQLGVIDGSAQVARVGNRPPWQGGQPPTLEKPDAHRGNINPVLKT